MTPEWSGESAAAGTNKAEYPSWLKYGLRAVIVLLALIAFLIWRASGGGQECVITALGEKLCGNDAVAWCASTDAIRDETGDTESQAVCDRIRD